MTILFSDVVGSTAMAARMDPEVLAQVMMAYFEKMTEILRHHGGVVEKYIGDAVLAVFGFPSVHEDDALRACRAALEMRRAVHELNERFQATRGVGLETRTGVNTGEVVAAVPTRDQTLPLGDPANVAARLESAAPPGEIYLGASTWALVRHAVDAERVPPLALKGKAEAVPAWRLLDVMPGPLSGLPRRTDSPWIRRDAELAALDQTLDAAVRERSCRLATVIGDPGVGKSRLALEFLARMEGTASLLRGRCLSYGEGITFWPLAEILKQAAGIGEGADADEATTELHRMLMDLEGRERVVPPLASAIGWLETTFPIEEVFWAARTALEHLARRTPLVVLIDDLQWAEQRLLDLIEHITMHSEGVSLLVLCLARPDLLEARPTWETAVPRHMIVRLNPLSEESSGLLAANLLGVSEVPRHLHQSVFGAAEGNPLFIEQVIAAWLDEGRLVGVDGRWTLTADPSSLAIPHSIRLLLQSRLDRLPSEQRSLLECASVVGQVFQRGALVELSDSADRAVDAGLEALAARGFIDRYTETSTPDPSYRFHHVLLRDAAYAGALKGRRADLHERFGTWLRRSVEHRPKEYEELVGYHFEQAYRYLSELDPANERTTTIARVAFDHLASAGRRALARQDATAAVNLLSRAGALLLKGDLVRLALLPELGEALTDAGRLTDADAVLREAMAAATASRDDLLRARATIPWLYLQYYVDSKWRGDDVRHHVGRILPILEAAGDERGVAGALEALADARLTEGNFDGLEEMIRRVIDHATRASDIREETNMRAYLCTIALGGPTPVPDAIDRCHETLAWAESMPGADGCAGRVLRALGLLEAMAGRFQEARAALSKSAEIFERLGVLPSLTVTRIFAGEVELLAERPDIADEILREALEDAEVLGVYGYGVSLRLAEAALMRGRIDEADHYITESRWQFVFDRDNAACWRAMRARVLARFGRLAEAEGIAREAVTMLEGTGILVSRGVAHRALAEVLQEAGRYDEARLECAHALALFEQKGDLVRAAMMRDVLALPDYRRAQPESTS